METSFYLRDAAKRSLALKFVVMSFKMITLIFEESFKTVSFRGFSFCFSAQHTAVKGH